MSNVFYLSFLKHAHFCGFSWTKEFIFSTLSFLKIIEPTSLICNIWLLMRETN